MLENSQWIFVSVYVAYNLPQQEEVFKCLLEVREIHVSISILRKNETIISNLQDDVVCPTVFIKMCAHM